MVAHGGGTSDDLDRAPLDRASMWAADARIRKPSGARKEREFYEELRALAEADPLAFDAAAQGLLFDEGPDCRRVALLRVLLDTDHARSPELFLRAIAELPDANGARGESVPRTALGMLRRRAAADPRARDVLGQVVPAPGAPSPLAGPWSTSAVGSPGLEVE